MWAVAAADVDDPDTVLVNGHRRVGGVRTRGGGLIQSRLQAAKLLGQGAEVVRRGGEEDVEVDRPVAVNDAVAQP